MIGYTVVLILINQTSIYPIILTKINRSLSPSFFLFMAALWFADTPLILS